MPEALVTTRDAIRLAKRVERWQKILSPLGVGHFRIEQVSIVDSSEMPGSRSANASVRTSQHYDSAEFWFSHEYLSECDEASLDETIIHEWLHVAMRDLDASLDGVSRWMPGETLMAWEDVVDHEREGLIERLARLIYTLHSQ